MPFRAVAADAFSTQRQKLWDLCYRATGTASDADVLLRDCFRRAMERPLMNRRADWRPHLIRSAALLAMDALRRRKRRHYIGCWLPSPVETGNEASGAPRPGTATPAARYDAVESGSTAFLLALEELDPRERLSFVLSDTFGMPVNEVASTLELTSATVKSALERARRRMTRYQATREPPTVGVQLRTADLLRLCLDHLQSHDADRLESLLTPDAQLCFDAGGEFVAPSGRIVGPARIARTLLKFGECSGPTRFAFRMLNGLPAAVGIATGRARWAKHFVFRVETREGLLAHVQAIMASEKLTAVRFDPA